jgi:hypothetical protein
MIGDQKIFKQLDGHNPCQRLIFGRYFGDELELFLNQRGVVSPNIFD